VPVSRPVSRPLLLAAAVTAIILACGPRAQRRDADAAAKGDANTNSIASADTAVAASARVSVAGGVRFTLYVTNLHDRALELRFPSGQTHDFRVEDAAGREVWRWSAGRLFTQALQNTLLESRETIAYAEHWDAAGLTGRFTAIASLPSSNHPVQERIEFVLP
jgi:hypothetical protein